jgi:hypothetical protein
MAVTGILGHTWAIVLVVVGLLSGALALLREMQLMYFPPKAGERSVFWSWVRIAFIVAAVLLWWDEHSKVKQLSAAAPQPTIQVNTPPAVVNSPPQTAYMKAHDPQIVVGSYKLGGNWAVSVECENTSQTVIAQEAVCQDGLHVVKTTPNAFKQPVVDKSIQDEEYLKFRKEMDSAKPNRRNYGPGDNGVSTVFTPTINDKLDKQFRSGAKTILFLADFNWKDGTGEHHNEVCSWLQISPQMFSGPVGTIPPNTQFVWQYCLEHNGVRK